MDDRTRRRRWMRLYLAAAVATFVTTLVCQAALLVLQVRGVH